MQVALAVLVAPALAEGSVVFLGLPPDPTLMPRQSIVDAAAVVGDASFSAADQAALDKLAAEMEAVRPLLDEFDGELAIMSRLQVAISEVHVLRDEQDRALVYSALVLQGYAVHRYFQDKLATEPAAAPYRVSLNGQVVVAAWVDAVALDPNRNPPDGALPDAEALRAFDDARAQIRVAQAGEVVAERLPEGAQLVVDGQVGSAKVPPGWHRAVVQKDGKVIARAEGRVEAGGRLVVKVGAQTSDIDALVEPLGAGPDGYSLSPAVAEAFAHLPAPVYVVVPGKKGPNTYVIEGKTALRYSEPESEEQADTFVLHAGVGGGWMWDEDWCLAVTAPGGACTQAQVNAGAPVLTVQADANLGPITLGAGADLFQPLGAAHSLPGVPTRAHPYAAVGLPVAQLTVGALFPWKAAAGVRGRYPLGEHLEVQAAWLVGLGRDVPRDDGSSYEAGRAMSAYAAVGYRFGM